MYKIIKNVKELKEKSIPVESVEEAKDLIKILEKELLKHDNGIGLSAIQIGITKQVSVIRLPQNDKDEKIEFLHIINPNIIEKEEKFIHYGEGCLSIPKTYLNIPRYKEFIIDNQVIDKNEFRTERQMFYYSNDKKDSTWDDGLTAIAVQHEIDHFEGVLITDKHVESTIVKNEKKVSRNEPCPCGSGKKYKKCCLISC
jgi:peptide deformylase